MKEDQATAHLDKRGSLRRQPPHQPKPTLHVTNGSEVLDEKTSIFIKKVILKFDPRRDLPPPGQQALAHKLNLGFAAILTFHQKLARLKGYIKILKDYMDRGFKMLYRLKGKYWHCQN